MELFLYAAPLIFASLGALWTELAGFLAISIEAWLEAGAFLTFCGVSATGSFFWGTLFAVLLTSFSALAAAVFVLKTGSNQYIAALALNLGAGGGAPLLYRLFFGGAGGAVSGGAAFSGGVSSLLAGTVFTLLALCAVLSSLAIRRTPFGLRLIAGASSDAAARERGINPEHYKIASWTIAGALAAAGGAVLTLRVGSYTGGIAAGRGWLALAAVFLGFRRVRGVCLAAFFLAVLEHLAVLFQANSFMPRAFLPGFPYIAALVLYAASEVFARRRRSL